MAPHATTRRPSNRSDNAMCSDRTALGSHPSTSATPANHASSLESHMTHRIQYVPGQTLMGAAIGRRGRAARPALRSPPNTLADGGYHALQVDAVVAEIPVLRFEIVKRSDDMKGFV